MPHKCIRGKVQGKERQTQACNQQEGWGSKTEKKNKQILQGKKKAKVGFEPARQAGALMAFLIYDFPWGVPNAKYRNPENRQDAFLN
eukprot:883569-Pelagomonas_calceolata.AAC.1